MYLAKLEPFEKVLRNLLKPRASTIFLPRLTNSAPTGCKDKEVSDNIEATSITNNKYKSMSKYEIFQALKNMSRTSSSYKLEKSNVEASYYDHVCNELFKNIRSLDHYHTLYALKILVELNTPINSNIIQGLLQIIRASVNDLSLENICKLYYILTSIEECPLRDALLESLPVSLEENLCQLSVDNLITLVTTLCLVTQMKKDHLEIADKTTLLILLGINKHAKDVPLKYAVPILISLWDLQSPLLLSTKIVNNMQEIIMENHLDLTDNEIISLLLPIATKKKNGKILHYNENLVAICVHTAMRNNVDFLKSTTILNFLNTMNYVHYNFLDYITSLCRKDETLLSRFPAGPLSYLISGFEKANYKSNSWRFLVKQILDKRLLYKTEYYFLKNATSLLSLDIYNLNIISKALATLPREHDFEKKSIMTFNQMLLLLYHSVKSLYPMYIGPYPADEIITYLTVPQKLHGTNKDYDITSLLQKTFGGNEYVYNNLITKEGHIIDHAIIFNKLGDAVKQNQINNTISVNFENLKFKPDEAVVLILNLNSMAYSINTNRRTALTELYVKTLSAITQCKVISLNGLYVYQIPERERLPYLKKIIKVR
ncbi:uncharacterized protein [Prorops nasuta]|uniref:uncharacterized protein isoform X2 n=1 Tax=Prorops nasuta TaxID=863751 RepID=UPI0034CD2BFD